MQKLLITLLAVLMAAGMQAQEAVQESATAEAATADMIRNGIGRGRVKSIVTQSEDGYRDTVQFLRQGFQLYKMDGTIHQQQLERDRFGRLLRCNIDATVEADYLNPEEFIYSIELFSYADESCRPQLRHSSVAYQDADLVYYHYYYDGESVSPDRCFEVEFNESDYPALSITNCVYRYLEFDEYGNWTKREVSRSMQYCGYEDLPQWDSDELPQTEAERIFSRMLEMDMSDRAFAPLMLRLEQTVMPDLKLCDKQIETREIEYWK